MQPILEDLACVSLISATITISFYTCALCTYTVEIGLERNFYTGSESTGVTEEICAVVFIDENEFSGGIDGVRESFRNDFGVTNIVVDATITSRSSTGPNAATPGNYNHHNYCDQHAQK